MSALSRRSSSFHRYLRCLLGSMLLAAAADMALVIAVDPYGLYGHLFERAGFNTVKPALSRYQDEIKLSHAAALAPAIFIQGNSRAEIGFDPDGPALSRAGMPAYNLAISGSSIAVAHSQLDYMLRIGHPPKLIVLGLEFLDFIDAPGSRLTPVSPPTLPAAAPPRHPVERGFWRFDSLFSLRALEDALRTLRIQHEADAETTTPRGFNPLNEYRAMARSEGYYALFRQRAQENARVYLRKAKGRPSAADAAHLAAILQLAARSGIAVKLVIYPYHAQILALFEESGLWPAFEAWKRQLTGMVAALRQDHPTARLELFDFSGYSALHCERIPAKADRLADTRWYWEGGHFKKALGERVLERLLSDAPGDSAFGFRLEADTAAANRRRIVAERQQCLRDYPALFQESAALVAAALRR